MLAECEFCKIEKECTFAGNPAAPETGKEQNGCWLCAECMSESDDQMNAEMDQIIAELRDMTVEQREEVAQNLVNNTNLSMTIEDARQWIQDSINNND